jgi:hypothetical protein
MTYSVPGYDEISHFRAPYKDSMMGFGAGPAVEVKTEAATPLTAAAAVSSGAMVTKVADVTYKPVLKASEVLATSTAVRPSKTVTGFAPHPDATKAIGSVMNRKPRAFSSEVKQQVDHFVKLLDDEANFALRGPDPRLWPLKAVPSFDQLWRTKAAILVNRDSRWHKAFKEQLATFLRNRDALDAALIVPQLYKAIFQRSIGWTTAAKLPTAAQRKLELAMGPASRVFATEKEAVAHFSQPSVTAFVMGVALASLDAKVAKVRQVSVWGIHTQIAVEDALKADEAEQRKLYSYQRVAVAVKAAMDAKRKGIRVEKAVFAKIAKLKLEDEKSDKALKDQLLKSEQALAKAKDENAALKVSVEDMKTMIAKEEVAPSAEKPPVPPAPAIPASADALPVPKTGAGDLPDPTKLRATGDSAKDQKEVDADIKAAGVEPMNVTPYLIGAGIVGALAFVALRPKAATPNRRRRRR